jgi:hypothetical protein
VTGIGYAFTGMAGLLRDLLRLELIGALAGAACWGACHVSRAACTAGAAWRRRTRTHFTQVPATFPGKSMTEKEQMNSALLIMDVQQGVVDRLGEPGLLDRLGNAHGASATQCRRPLSGAPQR